MSGISVGKSVSTSQYTRMLVHSRAVKPNAPSRFRDAWNDAVALISLVTLVLLTLWTVLAR